MNLSVKILILNWNGGDVLLECLNSVSGIDYDNFKIVVIDNGSTDKSIKNIHNQFPNVEVIALNRNHGYAKAYNKAFELIGYNQDDFFMLLNNDTIIDQNIISNFIKSTKLIKEKNGDDRYILSPKIFYLNKKETKNNILMEVEDKKYQKTNIVWYAGGKVNLEYGIIKHVGINTVEQESLENQNKYLEDSLSYGNHSNYITGCCLFAPTYIFKELNGFDDTFFMYCEDVDLSLRATQKNINLVYCSKATLWHRVSYSLGSQFNYKKISFQLSSLLKLYNKHVKWYLRYFSFCLLLLRMLTSRIKLLIWKK